MNEVIWSIVGVLGGAFIVWAADKVRQWKEKTSLTDLWLAQFVGSICEIAEKKYNEGGQGKQKLAYVLGYVENYLAVKGIPFDSEKITDLVDQYVRDVLNAGRS